MPLPPPGSSACGARTRCRFDGTAVDASAATPLVDVRGAHALPSLPRLTVALAVVVAFGRGTALTLTGVGLIVPRGRDALPDRVSRSPALRTWSLRLPLFAASASAAVVGGAVAAARLAGS
ncbi:hypothetical protein [Streptomyces sp. NPDC002133]|uniref:hypothetical protein n=1 Tax=Streptomyces sp. NPDC002133 TaxID=3154409 RepID=UPI00332414ED